MRAEFSLHEGAIFTFPQKRHPERSASQSYRVTQRLCAESKDLCGAYLTPAAQTFSTTETREQNMLRYTLDGRGLVLSPKIKTVADPPGAGSVFEKVRAAKVSKRPRGPSTPRTSIVPCNRALRRSAQDDVFAASWRCKNWLLLQLSEMAAFLR